MKLCVPLMAVVNELVGAVDGNVSGVAVNEVVGADGEILGVVDDNARCR
jgi:hypothetical protein